MTIKIWAVQFIDFVRSKEVFSTLKNLIRRYLRASYMSYLLLGVAGWVIVILAHSGLTNWLDYDEGYNLQVIDSLVKGNGYATHGSVRLEAPWLFDPYITTGPVVLLPLALSWWVTDGSLIAVRIVMLLFAALYICGILGLIGFTGEKLVSATAAISAPLMVMFAPERVLGEVPAAAAIIWAAWGVSRNKPLIAGLAVGLAVQIKLTYGLAGGAMLLVWFIMTASIRPHRWITSVSIATAAAIIPTICFELYRLISLGSIDRYLESIEELRSFLVAQKIENWLEPNSIGRKVAGLYQVITSPGWIAIFLAALALWIVVVLAANNGIRNSIFAYKDRTESGGRPGPTELRIHYQAAAYVGLVVGGLLMLWGWLTQSTQPAPRQGMPAVLLVFPVLAAVCASLLTNGNLLRSIGPIWRWTLGVVGATACACLMLALIGRGNNVLTDKENVARQEEQRQVAEAIRKSGAASISVDGWWQNPELQFLTGLPGTPIGTQTSRQLLVVQDYQVTITGSRWEKHKAGCAEVIYESPFTLLCWPLPVSTNTANLKILDWGPKSTMQGVVPNAQPDGGAGIWIKISGGENLGRVKALFSGRPAKSTDLHASGDLITVSISKYQFREAGVKEMAIQQVSTGKIFPIGVFTIEPKTE